MTSSEESNFPSSQHEVQEEVVGPPKTVSPDVPDHHPDGTGDHLLLFSIFLIAICALIYELIAGAVSSYLLGSSVTHFSLVIGLFLSAMGVGAYLTRFFAGQLLERFVQIELLIGLIGGTSALSLFCSFTYIPDLYMTIMIMIAGSVGALVGMEIPIIIRVLEERRDTLRLTVANVMAVDYLGALAASLAFPFLLVPRLGLMRTSFLFGLLNLAVAWVGIAKFWSQLRTPRFNVTAAGIITSLLLVGFVCSGSLVSALETQVYPDQIILAQDSPFQRVIVTHWKEDTRLFLNGALQFSSVDEYRYHEALVHPAMRRSPVHRDVLILGGGDGLAVREVLKYPEVHRIDLVDLDPHVTQIFTDNPKLSSLNEGSLSHPKVHIHNVDAVQFLRESQEAWDVVIMDLPDPETYDLGRLYTLEQFATISRHLRPHSVIVAQSTSPFYARKAFWCIAKTLDETPTVTASGPSTLEIRPYHLNVPSFGEWGFILAAQKQTTLTQVHHPLPKTRYLTQEVEDALFVFPRDLQTPDDIQTNRLNTQHLVHYYSSGYHQFYGDHH